MTVMTSGCVVVAPEVGLMLSHEADALAVQFSVPCPVLVMVKVCEVEAVVPSIIMNEKGSGVSPMMGGGVVGGGGAGGLLGGAGGLLGGAGWGLGVGSFPRFNNRCMNPLKPPPF